MAVPGIEPVGWLIKRKLGRLLCFAGGLLAAWAALVVLVAACVGVCLEMLWPFIFAG
jgi:hypothetical protein